MLLSIAMFSLPCGIAFAQEDPGVADVEAPAPDAHTIAEQAIVFGDDATGTTVAAPTTSAFGVFKLVLTLALVALAIYGVAFLFKKAARGGRASSDPFLKVLASAHVGVNRGVHVVSLGSQAWLVGSAEHGVNLIGEITDKETVDAMLLEDSRRSAEMPGRLPDFKSMLRKLGMQTAPDSPTPDDIRKRSERLKGI
jgi:flagellar protein FliO/FliZ